MSFKSVRYFYYFQWNLEKHLHFYTSLQNICSGSKINLELITFIKFNDYFANKQLVRKYRQSGFKVLVTFSRNYTAIIYFFLIAFLNRKIVIHFKQTDPGQLTKVRNLFKDKLCFITDLEGDRVSEQDYLLTKIESVEPDDRRNKIEELIASQKIHIQKFDYLFVFNQYFKDVLENRFPAIDTRILVSHLMSFVKNELYFDEVLRVDYRKKLEWENNTIVTYIGNVYYPWQNVSKTIKIYKIIKKKVNYDAKLLLLVNRPDHFIAAKFLKDNDIDEEDYKLIEVQNSDVIGYMNASDLGIVLRDFHQMNRVVTSGKLLDYLGCGLPVITTSVLVNLPISCELYKYGIILESLDDPNNIIDNDIAKWLMYDSKLRQEISKWANENLSLNVLSVDYQKLLLKLGE